jgi:hypothetical protein
VSRNAVFRLVAFAVLLGALRLAGFVSFDLPWRDPSFQISGATVILYLVWSTAFPRPVGGSMSLQAFAPYAVLLVSAVDGLMLGLTPFPGPAAARWAGPAALAAGTILGALRSGGARRAGEALRLAGVAIGLNSIAGLVLAVPAFMAGSREETATPEDGD